eukprot:361168-Chlamydomonas_euryale.AAC.8
MGVATMSAAPPLAPSLSTPPPHPTHTRHVVQTPEGFNEWRDVKEDTEKMVSHHLTHVAAQLSEVRVQQA